MSGMDTYWVAIVSEHVRRFEGPFVGEVGAEQAHECAESHKAAGRSAAVLGVPAAGGSR